MRTYRCRNRGGVLDPRPPTMVVGRVVPKQDLCAPVIPMLEHVNPWLAVPPQPPYVLPCDRDAIDEYNAEARETYKIRLDVLPEPFVGIATAPVVLLGLNPGFDDQDPEVHARPQFQALLRNNYSQGSSAFPFYFLDPTFESPGRQWWERKLRWLLEKFEPKELARSILCVEYFSYHSSRFRHASLELPSQEYGFGLVRSAIARGAVVVIMRGSERWIERVPELEGHSRAFKLNNPQNVVVSPGNCAGFDVVVSAIRDGIVNEGACRLSRVIYAVDIGSTRCKAGQTPNFAWARVDPADPRCVVGSSEIGKLADRIVRDLQDRQSVALGFEAPLFIPVPAESSALCYGRKNEGSRSFAAPVGLAVATLGLHQAAWILRRIADSCGKSIQFETDARSWPPSESYPILFCWEAFVSEKAHGRTHVQDAATAAMAFLSAESNLAGATTIMAERPLSLIAAAALWSGLATDLDVLHQPTVVIRPDEPFAGDVQAA